MDLKEQGTLSASVVDHWYYVSKGRAIIDLLGHRTFRRLLDVGAGSGVFTQLLVENRVVREALCIDTGYPNDVVAEPTASQVAFARSTDSRDFDLVLMVDVLEHVDDDVGLVRHYVAGLPPGALLVVTVPAFRFLWSPHDDYLGHKRRYTRRQLVEVLCEAGLEVVSSNYFFAAILPLAAVMRLLSRFRGFIRSAPPESDLRSHCKPVNSLMVLTHEVERRFLFRHNRIAGLTAMALARVGHQTTGI